MIQTEIDEQGEFIHLRDDAGGYLDRPIHKAGIIGTIFIDRITQQRTYQALGGSEPGEAVAVSLEVMEEIVRIMKTPLADLRMLEEEKLKRIEKIAEEQERKAWGNVPIFDAKELVARLSPETKDLLLRFQRAKIQEDNAPLFDLKLSHCAAIQTEYFESQRSLLDASEPEIVRLARYVNPSWRDLDIDTDFARADVRSRKIYEAENELIRISYEIAILFPFLPTTIN